jgi:hypothetical protein
LQGPSTRSRGHLAQNFFAVTNPPMSPSLRLRKLAATTHDAHVRNTTPQMKMCKKPAFHRHLWRAQNFSRAIPAPRKFFAARFADGCDADASEQGARHLHTKLSGVTVIFFLL